MKGQGDDPSQHDKPRADLIHVVVSGQAWGYFEGGGLLQNSPENGGRPDIWHAFKVTKWGFGYIYEADLTPFDADLVANWLEHTEGMFTGGGLDPADVAQCVREEKACIRDGAKIREKLDAIGFDSNCARAQVSRCPQHSRKTSVMDGLRAHAGSL